MFVGKTSSARGAASLAGGEHWVMGNPVRLGNKAALLVGLAFVVADNFFPLLHEFGAWRIGCLFCYYYSVTSIAAEHRASRRLKMGLYALLSALLVAALLFGDGDDASGTRRVWSLHPVLKVMGMDGK